MIISKDKLDNYIRFQIDANELIPGFSSEDLSPDDYEPENGDPALISLDNIQDLLQKFMDEDIDYEQFVTWCWMAIEMDLFVLDDEYGEKSVDWMFDTIEYLLKFKDEDTLLDKVDLGALIDRAESFKN